MTERHWKRVGYLGVAAGALAIVSALLSLPGAAAIAPWLLVLGFGAAVVSWPGGSMARRRARAQAEADAAAELDGR